MKKPVINSEQKEMMKDAFNRLPSRERTNLFGLGVGCLSIVGLLYVFLNRD